MNGHPEADAQREIVKHLRPVLPKGSILHHSANEVNGHGKAAYLKQSILKGMGVYPGFADLVLLQNGRSLFLEVKSKTGSQSKSQKEFQSTVEAQGHAYAIVRSLDDALGALSKHGFQTIIKRGFS